MIIILFLLGGALGWAIARWQGRVERKGLEERIALHEEFKGLSGEALRENNEAFLRMAGTHLESSLIKPVKETLTKFDGKLSELEKVREGAYAGLKEQVSFLLDSQRQLRSETANLVKALRTPNVRGRWGEIQLKRVVEMAGMLDHCDFFEQETVSTDERRLRPDLVVKLPGNKQIVVDAKAPLEAYLEAIESDNEQKMHDHARQIRTHMTQLSRKSYWEQFQPTPEFVVLFLPGETFFSAALQYDPSLIEVGVQERVILATPTTLIALLRSVAYGWRQESLSENAAQISALGRELYKRLGDMSGHFSKVGKSLGGAVEAYNKTIASFESRVLVSARKFKDLEASAPDKEIELVEPLEKMAREVTVQSPD